MVKGSKSEKIEILLFCKVRSIIKQSKYKKEEVKRENGISNGAKCESEGKYSGEGERDNRAKICGDAEGDGGIDRGNLEREI
jgi:hypothetical protein